MKPTPKINRKRRCAAAAGKQEDPRPVLGEEFGDLLADRMAAGRRNTLAILKLLELIVSGRIPQRAGEDYFITACRIIVHGLSGLQTTAATRRAVGKALAEIKRDTSSARSPVDWVQMRSWRGKRVITRSILLLASLEGTIGRSQLIHWLHKPNPNLGSRAPVDLVHANRWAALAVFLDDMLTGSTT